MLDHLGIKGYENADKLAKRGSEKVPEPNTNRGIPKSIVRSFINDWVWRKHNYWENFPKQKYVKTFIKRLWSKRTGELSLNKEPVENNKSTHKSTSEQNRCV